MSVRIREDLHPAESYMRSRGYGEAPAVIQRSIASSFWQQMGTLSVPWGMKPMSLGGAGTGVGSRSDGANC